MVGQVAQHAVQRAQLRELPEDQPHDRRHLLIRVEADRAFGAPDVADWQGEAQLATPRLVPPALVHPLLEHVQLRLGERPVEPQQEPVVVLGRIVHPIEIGDQRAEQRAQL